MIPFTSAGVALGLVLATLARAKDLQSTAGEAAVGIGAAAAAIVVVVIIVAVHYSAKRSITGCVAASGNGMTITDENNKQVYALSGVTGGLKVGDVLKVHGTKHKAGKDAPQTRSFLVKSINHDYGPCSAAPATRATP